MPIIIRFLFYLYFRSKKRPSLKKAKTAGGLNSSIGAEDTDSPEEQRSDISDFESQSNFEQLLQSVTSNIITTICVTFPDGMSASILSLAITSHLTLFPRFPF